MKFLPNAEIWQVLVLKFKKKKKKEMNHFSAYFTYVNVILRTTVSCYNFGTELFVFYEIFKCHILMLCHFVVKTTSGLQQFSIFKSVSFVYADFQYNSYSSVK